MTTFSALEALAGLSHQEAADYLSVRIDTVQSWASGRRRCPQGAIERLIDLIRDQESTAAETMAKIAADGAVAEEWFDLVCPSDDHRARVLGWPSVGAWAAMTARIIAGSPRNVRIVTRESKPTTACAGIVPGRNMPEIPNE